MNTVKWSPTEKQGSLRDRQLLVVSELVQEQLYAQYELRQELTPEQPQASWIPKLAQKFFLIDNLYPLHLKHFLEPEQRDEFEQIMARWGKDASDINFEPGFWDSVLESMSHSTLGTGIITDSHRSRHQYQQDLQRLRTLHQQAREQAEQEGYTVSAGALYTPEEQTLGEAIQAYQRARRTVMSELARANRAMNRSDATPDAAELRPVEAILERYGHWPAEAREKGEPLIFVQIREQLDPGQLNAAWQDYVTRILDLADLGVATPELALAGHGEALPQGINRFNQYHQLHQQAEQLTQAVKQKLDGWHITTAGQVALPTFLFEDERQAYEDYLSKRDACHQAANTAASQMQPARRLLWIEDHANSPHEIRIEPQPVTAVTRPGFPLREYLLASREQPLAYLSLEQLIQRVDETAQKTNLRAAQRQEKSFPGRRPAQEHALGEWLRSQGARELPLSLAWFDAQGRFQPEALHQALQQRGWQIESLQHETTRQAYGTQLRHWLHTDRNRRSLRFVDFSYTAQMLRLKHWLDAPDQNPLMIQTQARQIRYPVRKDEHTSQVQAVTIQDQWHRLQGRVELAPVEFPPQAHALANPVWQPLGHGIHATRRNMGAYSLNCSLMLDGLLGVQHAWGFNIFDPRSLKVQHRHHQRSFHYQPEQGFSQTRKTRTTERDEPNPLQPAFELSAFMGARAGVTTLAELNWHPPADIRQQLRSHEALERLGMLRQQLDGWNPLCRGQLAVETGAGIGGSLHFQLSLRQGRFKIRCKASLFFGSGVGGAIELDLDLHHLALWIAMINQALRDSQYQKIEWIHPDAFEQFSQLALTASLLQIDPGLLLLQGLDSIRALYEKLTQGRLSGLVAYKLVNDPRKEDLKTWIQTFPPEALGALFYTLTRPPRAFEIEEPQQPEQNALADKKKSAEFTAEQSRDLQQQAIHFCLNALIDSAQAATQGQAPAWSKEQPLPEQWLFSKALARMHPRGHKTRNSTGQAYCENRANLDWFMRSSSGSSNPEVDSARNAYRTYANQLGLHYQGQCDIRTRGGNPSRVRFTGQDASE